MENKEYLNKLHHYSVLRKKYNDDVSIFIDNLDYFNELFLYLNSFVYKESINLSFVIDNHRFELTKANSTIFFDFDLHKVNFDLFDELLYCKINCYVFLAKSSYLIQSTVYKDSYEENINKALNSWDLFKTRVGYKNTTVIETPDYNNYTERIKKENVVWCYNKSSSGKTFLGIKTLDGLSKIKFVYNPSSDSICNVDTIKILIEFGKNISLLCDDLQCDTEFAKTLLDYISSNKASLINRKVFIFLISWLSFVQSREYQNYKNTIFSLPNNPRFLINTLKDRLKNDNLITICKDNLALISAAANLKDTDNRSISEVKKDLFECFIKTTDRNQLKLIHILSVLGAYEFEIPRSFLNKYETDILDISNIITAKEIENNIFVAHRSIASFIADYIEHECRIETYNKTEIITEYINYIDSKYKWKALLHLIGENDQNKIGDLGFIWKLMYDFQKNLKAQTIIDPSWNNVPSSMCFVISTAEMLGVVDEYKEVIMALCSKFIIDSSGISIKYNELRTTEDFEIIQNKMIEEDRIIHTNKYETGNSIDMFLTHKNWLFGLLIGIKDVLIDSGYNELIHTIENVLKNTQSPEGYWYPKRIPWVTARILIGLSKAGYSYNDDFIKKGVDYLISTIECNKWVAHTGGWNNEYETSSLCLEAIINCCDSTIYDNSQIQNVISFLEDNKQTWMLESYEIDGATTACALFKILGSVDYLLIYLKNLTNRKIHKIVESKLDYSKDQSCETTQIAYYVIELCWYILKINMNDLLNSFITRSNQEKDSGKDFEKMNAKKIFISYSEDSTEHIKRVARIAHYLEDQGYTVYFYEDVKLGTNNFDFMQKINESDLILVIGTKEYREKVLNYKSGGVWFETGILAQAYMKNNYERIIPLAFDDFDNSLASPFSLNKGIRVKRVDERFLNKLSIKLKQNF